MEIKELQNRIEKKQIQITKMEKRVVKLQANDPYGDLRRATRELEDAKTTLKNYQEKLAIEVNKENEEKIEVLVNFLNNWKEQASQYYHQEAKQAYDEYEEHKMIDNQLKENNEYVEYRKLSNEEYHRYRKIELAHSPIVRNLRKYREPYIDEVELEKILNREVKAKYEDLVYRISKVVGEIKDCSNLRIGGNGSINGIVTGSNCKARVETITAGGYNIQCLHYRVLVNQI